MPLRLDEDSFQAQNFANSRFVQGSLEWFGDEMLGCPPGIRTPIRRVRVVGPTIEREGNTDAEELPLGCVSESLARLN